MSPRARNQLASHADDAERSGPKRGALPDQSARQAARPPPPRPGAAPQNLQLEVASYIEMLSAELRGMAKVAGLGGLAYFLEMARLEASIQVEHHAGSLAEWRDDP